MVYRIPQIYNLTLEIPFAESKENMSVAHRVLDCPELLELILLQLPIRSLLHAQRICRSFRDAIRSSPTLQQALFFQPLPRLPTDSPATQDQVLNPLLVENFRPFFESRPRSEHIYCDGIYEFDDLDWSGGYGWADNDARERKPEVQEKLHDTWPRSTDEQILLRPSVKPFASPPLCDAPILVESEDPDLEQALQCVKAYQRPDASWRKMLPAQPPISSLRMQETMESFGGRRSATVSITFPCDVPDVGLNHGELTMGNLYKLIEIPMLSYKRNRFRIDWHLMTSAEKLTENSPTSKQLMDSVFIGVHRHASCVMSGRRYLASHPPQEIYYSGDGADITVLLEFVPCWEV